MIRKIIILLFAFVLMTGCEDDVKNKAEGTWFGGEIINPIDHVVTLSKGNKMVATIPMDQNNRFLYQLKNLQPGLYEFYHKERQLVYLEQGDSVMLRVNTIDFDESLTFSGYGADENNLLINLFLKNEDDDAYMARNDIYQKSSEEFQQFLDSLRDQHSSWEDNFKHEEKFSPQFESVIKMTIDYDLYARKEVYPLIKISDSKIRFINDLPKSFYVYRKDLTFNNGDFLPSYTYKRFLINYFNQGAFKKYAKDEAYNSESYLHNKYEMALIDSIVPNQQIKSYLLTHCLRSYLENNSDVENGRELYEHYLKSGPNPADKTKMKELFDSFNSITRNKPLPDEPLINAQLETKELREIIKRPTVLYFWSSRRRMHMHQASTKAKALRKHFPQYDVIGINMDQDPKLWLRSLNALKSPKQYAYQFKVKSDKAVKDLAINSVTKTIIVDKNGTILDAHANMFSPDFEETLLGYLNR